MQLIAQGGIVSFEQGSGRGGAPGLFHYPVGVIDAEYLTKQNM